MTSDQDRLQMDFNAYYGAHNFTPTHAYENLSYANWGTPAFNTLNQLSIDIETGIFDTLLNNPALYMYLSIILLILMHATIRSREIYLMYVPNLFNIIIIFFSTPIQDYRYLYPNLLIFYLLIIIWIGLRSDTTNKNFHSIRGIFKNR